MLAPVLAVRTALGEPFRPGTREMTPSPAEPYLVHPVGRASGDWFGQSVNIGLAFMDPRPIAAAMLAELDAEAAEAEALEAWVLAVAAWVAAVLAEVPAAVAEDAAASADPEAALALLLACVR